MPPTDPSPSPSAPRRPGLLRRTLRHYWGGILAVTLLGSLAAGALVHQAFRPAYRAVSLLRVDPMVTDLYHVRDPREDLDAFLQTQVQLITSPNVLIAAGTSPKASMLERVQKAGDVAAELRKAVRVAVIPQTYLIEVSMTSPDGYEAATIVNAVVDAFLEANGEWSDGMTRAQIKNLEQYHLDLQNQVEELERKWKALAAKADLDPRPKDEAGEDAGRVSITIEEYRRVYRELNAIGLELAQARALLASAKATVAKVGTVEERETIDRAVDRRFRQDPEAIELAARIKAARDRHQQAQRIASAATDPAVRLAKSRLDDLLGRYKRLWDERSEALRKEITVALGAGPVDEAQGVREATEAVTRLTARQVSLKSEADRLDARAKVPATDAVDIALIQEQRATLKKMQDEVVRRLEQLKYEAKGEARIRPVNPSGAMVPNRPIADHRPLAYAVIPIVLLFVSVSLFAGIEADNSASTAKKEAPREV